MTYDPRQTFSAQQSAFSRASGVTSSKSNANKQAADSMRSAGIGGVGGKPTTSAAQRIQEQFRRETQKDDDRKGLGSKRDVKPKKTVTESLADRLKRAFGFAGGTTKNKKRPDPNPAALYSAAPFIIPAATAVTTTALGPAPLGADTTGMPSIYTPYSLEFGKGLDPMDAPEKPESAKIDIFDPLKEKVKRADEAPGLMAPPSMAQPAAPATAMSAAMTTNINKTLQSILSPDPDVPYVIQAGDTLSEIAVKTGTTVEDLVKENKIKEKDKIYTGNELKIPSAKSTKTKEDIVSSLIGGMGGVSELGSSFEGDGVQTAMSVVPSSVISDAIESTRLEDTLFDAIVIGESEDFDTVYKGVKIQPSKPITEMTVKEVRDWQEANVKAGAVSTAAGRFQIVGGTMKDLIKKGTISEDDIFDEATQRKAYKGLLEKRGYSKFKNKMSKAITENEKQKIAEDFLQGLAKEFASIPIPKDLPNRKNPLTKKGLKKGDSYYEGRFGNTTKGNPKSVDDYIEILKEFNTDPTTLVPPARPAGLMDKYTIPRPQPRPENL